MKQPAEQSPEIIPFYGPVSKWRELTGLGKTTTYELIKAGTLPTRKVGRRTLIDIRAGLAMLASQPSVHARKAA